MLYSTFPHIGSRSKMSAPASSSNTTSAKRQRVVIVPGNGCAPIEDANWYIHLRDSLNALPTSTSSLSPAYLAVAQTMPDPDEAYERTWLPFIREQLAVDEDTIVVGHSSGAEAAMRLCEDTRVKGLVLVSACHSDMGMESEAISGYYNRPWQWQRIKDNTQWIVQLHSTNDRLVPVAEAREVAQQLGSEYIENSKKGHFLKRTMPEVIEILERKRREKAERNVDGTATNSLSTTAVP